MLKKLILSLLMISTGALAMSDDKPFINISQRQAKDFLAGFGIGVAQGGANQLCEYKRELKGSKGESNIIFSFKLYVLANSIVAHKLESTYNGNDKINPASLCGRVAGHFLSTSIIIRPKPSGGELQAKFNVNIPSLLSLIPLRHLIFSRKECK